MGPLFRTVWRFAALGGGTFHCPREGEERDYTATRARPFLALLERPLLPLPGRRTLITCDTCDAVYDASVTSLGPQAAREVRSEDELALQAVVAAMVVSDSSVRDVEKAVAEHVVRSYARRPANPADGGGERLATTRRRLGDPFERLERIAGALDENARRRMLIAAYRVSAADRQLHPQEARLLMKLGEVLDLHPSQVREAMRQGRT